MKHSELEILVRVHTQSELTEARLLLREKVGWVHCNILCGFNCEHCPCIQLNDRVKGIRPAISEAHPPAPSFHLSYTPYATDMVCTAAVI